MDENEFKQELDSIENLTELQVDEKLELLVNTPMTYDGYRLVFYGLFSLMNKCGVTQTDERFRNAAYKKVCKMLEEGADLTEPQAKRFFANYLTSILSHFMNPPVPEIYILPKYVKWHRDSIRRLEIRINISSSI